MGLYRRMLKGKSRIYDNFLTNPKVVKISIISSLTTWFSALIIGFIVAQFDPQGYNIVDNYISDMGSFRHTPLPYFLDFGAIITSILMIPGIYYVEKQLAPSPIGRWNGEFPRMRYRLSGLGSFWMFFGIFGFMMIGVFSEDRTTALGLHFLFSIVVFSGFMFMGVFYGILIMFYKTEIPRLMGAYIAIVPLTTGIIFVFNFSPFWEWMMLFSLMIWIVPVLLIFLKTLNKE